MHSCSLTHADSLCMTCAAAGPWCGQAPVLLTAFCFSLIWQRHLPDAVLQTAGGLGGLDAPGSPKGASGGIECSSRAAYTTSYADVCACIAHAGSPAGAFCGDTSTGNAALLDLASKLP